VSTERWRGRIEDILDTIAKLQEFIGGMTPEQFAADDRTVGAVSYGFLVIGEATRHIPDDVRARHSTVPWAKMQAMRNVVAHDYRRVSTLILWETAADDLPSLVPLLREILERET
jgi:uncharacterized protein with HEPN domain